MASKIEVGSPEWWAALAAEVRKIDGVAVNLVRKHVPDKYGRCAECCSHSVVKAWPCALVTLVQ